MAASQVSDSILVLSNYPLSTPFKSRLEGTLGVAPAYLNVTELRQESLRKLVRTLRDTRTARVCVAVEDASGASLLPILRVLAALTRSPETCSVDNSMKVRPFSRAAALLSCVALLCESALSLGTVALAWGSLRVLGRATRMRAEPPVSRRVAYLNCNLWFGVKAGGSVGHISGVVNALSRMSYDVHFFSVGGRLMVDERTQHAVLRAPRMIALPFEATQYRFDRSCKAQICAALGDRKPAFIYQRMSLGNYTGVRISRGLKVPLICEYNGSEAWVAKNWGRPLKFHRLAVRAEDVMLRHSHVVVTISEVLRDELIERGVDRRRIVTYPNCIDPAIFDPYRFDRSAINALRARYGIANDTIVATFIGTFGQWHGVDVFAVAIRQLIEHHSEWLERARVRFLLVGDGAKMPRVLEILNHPLRDRFVVIAGLVPQHEAPLHLASSDVLFSPHVGNADGTRFFGSPTKLFEYMAMGRAIVASDLDQIGDVLSNSLRVASLPSRGPPTGDGRVALLTRPGSADDLVAALKFLVASQEWRDVLGRNARLLALDRFTWSRHVAEILAGLDRALTIQ